MSAEAAYQGAPASFSEQAARLLCGPARTLLGCRTFDELFDSLASGRARYGVVPIENAIVGPLPFLDGHAVRIEHELRMCISHALVGAAGSRLTQVRRVLAHPVAAAQCRRWFARRGLEIEPVWDGAAAVADILRDNATETAVLAPESAAERHGAAVLATGLEDRRDNWTRFALVRLLLRPPEAAGLRAGRFRSGVQRTRTCRYTAFDKSRLVTNNAPLMNAALRHHLHHHGFPRGAG